LASTSAINMGARRVGKKEIDGLIRENGFRLVEKTAAAVLSGAM